MTQYEKIEHGRKLAALDEGLGRLISIAPKEWRETLQSLQERATDEWHSVDNRRVRG